MRSTILAFILAISILPSFAQSKFYFNSTQETIFSSESGTTTGAGIIRYTEFLNTGMQINRDLSKKIGVYAGIDIKNVGFIEKIHDTTVKRRTYNLGIPVGLKIGNLSTNTYFFLGGGAELPLNYKEKAYTNDRVKKFEKFNEWFSNRTPQIMPYLFAGINIKGYGYKVSYYINNYLNQDYTDKNGAKPYSNYNLNLILLSFVTPVENLINIYQKKDKTEAKLVK